MIKGGCILLSKDYKKIALVYREKLNDYSFPKGHIEEGEDILECALRETEEETGRRCKLLKEEPIGINKYSNHEGDIETYMYLCIDDGPTTKEIKEEDKEEYLWIDIDKVEDTLTYNDLKEFWNSIKDKIKEK